MNKAFWLKPFKLEFQLLLLWALMSLWPTAGLPQMQVSAAKPSPQVQHFPVKTIRVEGNTLLPDDEVAALVAPLVGDERTMGDLQKGAAAVQRAYRDAGYGGVMAFVPEQDLSDGEAVIQVIEGKLAKIGILENQRYDEASIRESLPYLKEGQTPLIRRIDQDIRLANENPAKEL